MGKGDKKTKRGKIIMGSHGVRRPKAKPRKFIKTVKPPIEKAKKLKEAPLDIPPIVEEIKELAPEVIETKKATPKAEEIKKETKPKSEKKKAPVKKAAPKKATAKKVEKKEKPEDKKE